jgi:hypothetical protein
MRRTGRGKNISSNTALRISEGWQYMSFVELGCRCTIESDKLNAGMNVKKGAKVIRDRILTEV